MHTDMTVLSEQIETEISAVKTLLGSRRVLGKLNTCLDPNLYDLKNYGATLQYFNGSLNELAPAIINGEAAITLLDVPDALIALSKWPGQIKVIGPISPPQLMGCAFTKTSPLLRTAFNRFLQDCIADGTYRRLVEKYYPAVFTYYPEFFNGN